ncbi:MAG: LptF/LptG family permease [Arsenophonus sp.]|nr:MAG: LptF/LptG family permease [Arsenophonus sp.]
MIFFQYLLKESFKKQISVFFVLKIIFLIQKIIYILTSTNYKNISSNLIIILLGLFIPHIIQIILPLSLLLGILISYGKLYTNSEIIVMYSCGMNKKILIFTSLVLSFFSAILMMINVMYILPSSISFQKKILNEENFNSSIINSFENRFQETKDKKIIFFIEDINGEQLNNLFIIQKKEINKISESIIISNFGFFCKDKKKIILKNVTRYEKSRFHNPINITHLNEYIFFLHQKKNNFISQIEEKKFIELWKNNDIESKIEFHWRLILVFSLFIIGIMTVPLSETHFRKEKILKTIIPVLLFLIFFILENLLHIHFNQYGINIIFIMWIISFIFFFISIMMNC